MEKLTKTDLAKKLNISRPTLDKYLEEGFPNSISNNINKNKNNEDKELQKIMIENEIRLYECYIKKLKEQLQQCDEVEE